MTIRGKREPKPASYQSVAARYPAYYRCFAYLGLLQHVAGAQRLGTALCLKSAADTIA